MGQQGEERGASVQRVEDRLDHQDVGAALDEALDGLGVRLDQLGVAHVSGRRVVDVRRDRRGAAGRPEDAGHPARAVGRLGGHPVGLLATQPRGLAVQLARQRLQRVVGLGQRGRVEGVGLENVRARLEIGPVNRRDDVRPGEHQQVVVAAQIARVVLEALAPVVGLGEPVALDHRAHRPVQDEDALGQSLVQCGDSQISGVSGHEQASGNRA
ncbi:MAG: hypothetical protein R3F39_19575 [Myxococcota bacterium]